MSDDKKVIFSMSRVSKAYQGSNKQVLKKSTGNHLRGFDTPEDPLRVLRVARFAARYHHLGFKMYLPILLNNFVLLSFFFYR